MWAGPFKIGDNEYVCHGILLAMQGSNSGLEHLVSIGAAGESALEEVLDQSPIARASQINGLCSYGIGDEVACALLLLGHIQELKQERMCDLHGSAIHRSASIDGYDYGAFAEAWLVLLCAIALLLHWRFGGELLELVGSEAMVEDVLGVVFG